MATSPSIAQTGSERPARRLAVLIDADNAQPSIIESVLAEIARLGEAVVKRIYGDFTAANSSQWKTALHKNAIKPVQQFAYTTGKNATDIALIIDAMDLLHMRKLDGFCLVSSDSDFTALAMRLREEGLAVFGFGADKTPEAFRNSCQKFFLTEGLGPSARGKENDASKTPAPNRVVSPVGGAPKIPSKLVRTALAKSSNEDGWAHLGEFGKMLITLQPDFDARTYGFRKLSDLVKANTKLFSFEERQTPGQMAGNLYLRAK